MRGSLPFLLLLHPAACYVLPAATLARPPRAPAPACQLVSDAPPALSLNAPAKINLFLRILRKRTDGFHELASLFQTVSLMDRLDFWQLPEDAAQPLCSMEVTPDSLGAELIPTDESNLVMRALQLFAERTGETRRVHCRLHKSVPAQGGLGGGSCDAATALHAANRLAGFPVAESELIEWGGELGSDVGFFLSRGTAMCTGRGELIEPLPPLPPRSIWLVKPKAGLSTPTVFKALGLQPGEELDGPDPATLLAAFVGGGDDEGGGGGAAAGEDGGAASAAATTPPSAHANAATTPLSAYVNDLEPPAYSVMPRLQELRDELRGLGFDAVMMSGSGSTVFCVGAPGPAPLTWRAEVAAKYDAEVFEQAFCSRGEDEKLWYGEE